ncbi:MAG: carbohydrate ABC transporter permease [Acidobacteriota bacterium]
MSDRRALAGRIGLLAAAGFICAWSVAPFAWFALASLKSPRELAIVPPPILPASFHADNFMRLGSRHRLWVPVTNSVIVAGSTTIVAVPLAALAAYALSRRGWRSRSALLAGILAVSMFPQITLAPTIVRWLYHLGWINTHAGLIVPYVSLTVPLAVWILASFFREIPPELEDAARIDGCGPVRTLRSVFLPVAAPAIATAAILTFIYAWNEFFFASIIVDAEAVRTLPVAIARFHGRYSLPWGEVSAASIVATLPLLVLVLALQRHIARGLTAGAVKG